MDRVRLARDMANRWPHVFARCRTEEPGFRTPGEGHAAACHLHDRPADQNPMEGGREARSDSAG